MRPPIKFLRDATVAAMDLPSVKEQMNKIGVELVPPDDRSWYVSFTRGYLPKLLRCRDFPTKCHQQTTADYRAIIGPWTWETRVTNSSERARNRLSTREALDLL
jgi:hypothetical protein